MTVARLGALVAALMTAGCERGDWQEFAARHATYRFPAGDVDTVITKDRRFIRLTPAGEEFALVFDSRLDGLADADGRPRVFGMSRGPIAGLRRVETPAGIAVCRTAMARTECGLPVMHGGDHWSMLFPAGRIAGAEAMDRRARAFLQRHDAAESGAERNDGDADRR